MKINFQKTFFFRYSCQIDRLFLQKSNARVKTIGSHENGKSNSDVEQVWIYESEMPILPNGFGTLYPNLDLFFVGQSKLKTVKKQNFEHMNKVTNLFLGYNELVIFQEDAFWNLINLEHFFIDNNKVRALHKNLFINMPNLKQVHAFKNRIEHLDAKIFRSNPKLERVNLNDNRLSTIGVNFVQLTNIKIVDLYNNDCINTQFPDQVTVVRLNEDIRNDCNEGSALRLK